MERKQRLREHRMVWKCLVMALCACFLLAVFSVAILAVIHGGHHCVVDNRCAVCVHIRDAQSLLRRLFFVFACCGLLFAGTFRLAAGLGEASLSARRGTPVARKVRLNN